MKNKSGFVWNTGRLCGNDGGVLGLSIVRTTGQRAAVMGTLVTSVCSMHGSPHVPLQIGIPHHGQDQAPHGLVYENDIADCM